MTAVTMERSRRTRRAGAWIGIAAALVVAAIAGVLLSGIGDWAVRDALDPDSHGPTGAHAIARLLRDQGVDVVVARDRAAASEALRDRDATLALPDAPALSDAAVEALARDADDVVLLDPRTRTLRLLFPDATLGAAGSGDPVEPACDLADARRAGAVAPGVLFHPGGSPGVAACYPVGEDWGLLVRSDGERRLSAVDARALFTNEFLAEDGNAALALNLLGRHGTVVWYVPGIGDTDLTSGDVSLGEITPSWVSPVIVLLLVAAAAAGVWRGRRFGPLVAERLPVTVRASETTEGRARLYARSRDAVHAADQLRIGALGRLARLLGLGPSASAQEIADACAARIGWDPGAVRGILLDDVPRSDAQLVALHDRLRGLETAVRAAVRPPTDPGAG